MKKQHKQWLWQLAAVLLAAGLTLKLIAFPGKQLPFFRKNQHQPKQVLPAQTGRKVALPAAAAIPYHKLQTEQDLDLLLKGIGDAPVVLLGEASHGTSEFYTWRAAITKKLIQEKGFTLIAVEGDYPESTKVNRYIRGQENTDKKPEEVLQVFDRWPTWMWANHEVADLVSWLREHNKTVPEAQQVGFYGLDLYSLCKSLMEISAYLEKRDGKALPAAAQAIKCYRSYNGKPEDYAMSVLYSSENCKQDFAQMLKAVQAELNTGQPLTDEEFDAEQNAIVAANAEHYYRIATRNDVESWNIRDRHMMHTLSRLLRHHGPNAKVVVWEHNTHIGDARATDMAAEGMVNLGQLARQQLGQGNVYAVGFGTYSGTVLAATAWENPVQEMKVPPAKNESWEHKLHTAGPGNKLLFSEELRKAGVALRPVGHRAIGVVYNPEIDSRYNYVPSQITKRYDAFIFIDKTNALRQLEVPADSTFPPSLHPAAF